MVVEGEVRVIKAPALVSVIVPTKNSEQFLEVCLKSIRAQTYPSIELIVVDNFSNDGTAEIAKKYADKFFLRGSERSAQRNYGVSHASSNYVLIIDSDMQLDPRVIEDCVTLVHGGKDIKTVIIPEISVGEGLWAKCKALERECYIGDDTIEAARFFEKEVYLSAGGYDENLWGGEDWDLHERVRDAGWRIGRVQTEIKHHEGHLSLLASMKKKYYYGKSIHLYMSKHARDAQKKLRIFRPSFFRNWKKLIRVPHLALGMFFMKLCEFSAGGMGYFFGKRVRTRT